MRYDLISGASRIVVEVRNRGLQLVGGPIASCLSASCSFSISESGSWQATFPLRDPAVDALQSKKRFADFYEIDGEGYERFAFRGLVEGRKISTGPDGILQLVVEGRDQSAELFESPVGMLELSNAGSGVYDGPEQILAAANAFSGQTWALDPDGQLTTATAVYHKFSGEPAITALRNLSSRIGEHFRVDPEGGRFIHWIGSSPRVSGVRAIMGSGDAVAAIYNQNVCYIQRFEEEEDASGLYNRIYPFGAGVGGSRLTLSGCTITPPAGYTLSTSDNYLQNDASVVDMEKAIGRFITFNDVRPLTDSQGGVSDADLITASNSLYHAAKAELDRQTEVASLKVFRAEVTQLPLRVKVGETMPFIYEDDRYSVSEDFVILGIDHDWDNAGRRRSSLTICPVMRWRPLPDGGSALISDMEQGRIAISHPQMGVDQDTTSYRVFVGEDQVDEAGEIPLIFDGSVIQVKRVIFRYRISRLLGTSSAALLGDTTTGGGGATVTTTGASNDTSSSSGGSHSHKIYVHDDLLGGATVRDVYADANSSRFLANFSGTGSGSGEEISTTTSEGSHDHDIDHDHGITLSDHTHPLPGLTNTIGLYRAPSEDTFINIDLELLLNGTLLDGLEEGTPLVGGWFEFDITGDVCNDQFRPDSRSNVLVIRRKTAGSAGKTCMVDAVVYVRSIVQDDAIIF